MSCHSFLKPNQLNLPTTEQQNLKKQESHGIQEEYLK